MEISAANHNSFGLEGSRNVAPADDTVFHQAEIEMCGHFAQVDIVAEAHDIPVEIDSQDYVISSHVVEHVPDLLAAFEEWDQIVTPGGFIFIIVPKRDAHPPDANRPISPVSQVIQAWNEGWSMERPAPAEVLEAAGGVRGHYWVFTLESLLEIIKCANLLLPINWEVIATEETDSKAGNGHTVVIRTRELPLSKGLLEATEAVEKLVRVDPDSGLHPGTLLGFGPKFPSTSDIQKMPKQAEWPEAKRHISTDSFIGPDGKMGFLPPIPPSAAWTPPTPEESDLVQALHDEGSFSEKFLNSFPADDCETPDKSEIT